MTTEKKVPSLLLQIQAKRDMLTAAELRVADYILAHPESVLQLSVPGCRSGGLRPLTCRPRGPRLMIK